MNTRTISSLTAAPILVAEDEYSDAFFFERAWLKAGLDAPLRFVKDGQDAIDYLSGTNQFENRTKHPTPTILVLDLKMPRMNGFDVLQWVRRHPVWRRLPVIILTSSDLDADVNMAYDLGANSYLLKPDTISELIEVVRKLEHYWLKFNTPPELS